MSRPYNTVVGDRLLCAWQPVAGVTWVQTREPKFYEKLRKRQDSKLVVRSMHGGYLMTFEFLGKNLSWAERLIARYTKTGDTANEPGEAHDSLEDQPLTGQELKGDAISPSGPIEPLGPPAGS